MTSKEFIFQNELDQGLPTKEYSNFEGRVVSRLGGLFGSGLSAVKNYGCMRSMRFGPSD
jgi:hypothetical protein